MFVSFIGPSKLIANEPFMMLNECYKLATYKYLKCDLVQKISNKKSAVISNHTLKSVNNFKTILLQNHLNLMLLVKE